MPSWSSARIASCSRSRAASALMPDSPDSAGVPPPSAPVKPPERAQVSTASLRTSLDIAPAAASAATTAVCPCEAAASSALRRPEPSTAGGPSWHGSAERETKACTTSRWPSCAAAYSAVSQPLARVSARSQPSAIFRSFSAVSGLLWKIAQSTRLPCSPGSSGQRASSAAPLRSSARTLSKSPYRTASRSFCRVSTFGAGAGQLSSATSGRTRSTRALRGPGPPDFGGTGSGLVASMASECKPP
mmetsp:Transcript_89667/g.231410  ORF Transcript_89667/g.231410 Transcript_89667/m.231410 type:complete len:245 (+) Transcript_89667:1316-2050(+)